MTAPRRVRGEHVAAVVLALLVVAIYWRAGSFPFVSFDDEPNLVANPSVRDGLSAASLRWAVTARGDIGWLPLARISHLLDVSIFGWNAGGHHLVNALFHLLNVLLLFRLLRKLTGRTWESGLAAALFAVHPLHVESVAWVSERKDVLCAFFFLLATEAYAAYAARPGAARYAAAALLFAGALLSKPMAVTFPFVLLLLDFWPLGRLCRAGDPGGRRDAPPGSRRPARPVREKVPLFVLSAAICAVTYLTQHDWGAVLPTEEIPWWARAANAIQAYGAYLRKTIWPSGLAVFYPHPGKAVPLWPAAASALILCLATVVAIREARRRPWLATGWFWYLGMLVPVIGLVQVGGQAMADRYTYLPLVGPFVAAAWGASELRTRLRIPAPVAAAAAGACLLALAACASAAVGYWRGAEPLYRRALAVTARNWRAHALLGDALRRSGRDAEAAAHFREAIRIEPRLPEVRDALGAVLDRMGRAEEAVAAFREELRLRPDSASTHYELAVVLGRLGRAEEAVQHYREALRIRPDQPEAHNNLGVYLAASGAGEEAIRHFREGLRLRPGYAEAHHNLGMELARGGHSEEGIAHLREAIRLRPGYAEAHNNLGVILARKGSFEEAAREFREALRLRPEYEGARQNLERAARDARQAR